MNNRFKFRYWHTKENKYIYTQCDCLATMNTVLYSLIGKPNKGGWYETDIEKAYNDFELIPEQCTGLKDKNDNLIYEGDIIKDRGDIQYQIMWKDASFFAVAMNEFDYMPDCLLVQQWLNTWKVEIIGNIHKQKEQQ